MVVEEFTTKQVRFVQGDYKNIKVTTPEDIDIAELFKVFADSTRVKIINVLLENKLCVGDIAALVGGTQSAISHQLRILKSAKLVKYTKIGKTVYYELSDDHVKKLFSVGKEHINEI